MAVYTDVSDEALRDFLACYDVGPVQVFKGIAEGVENSNFFLGTQSGNYILTLYEKRTERHELPYFLSLMQHLAARDLPCPLPVIRCDGEALGELAGRPAALVTFLNGVSIRRPTAHHCAQLGEALARMHQATADFPLTRENKLCVKGWRPLLECAGSASNTISDGLLEKADTQLQYLEKNWPQNLPKGTIHADLFPNNVLFLNDHLSGLIDFYFAATDQLAYDLAICINAWCFEPDGSFNITKGRAMLTAYNSLRPLEAAEKEAFALLACGAAMRFLVTRLVDFLNVPAGALVRPLDPMEYFRKLLFHSTLNSIQDYGFGNR